MKLHCPNYKTLTGFYNSYQVFAPQWSPGMWVLTALDSRSFTTTQETQAWKKYFIASAAVLTNMSYGQLLSNIQYSSYLLLFNMFAILKSMISAEIINLDIQCSWWLNLNVYKIEMSQKYFFIKMTLQRYQDVHSSEIFPLLSRQFMSESRYLQPKRPLSNNFID